MIRLLSVALASLVVMSGPAYAYLDPGTASIVLQAVVGAIAAAGLFFGAQVSRFFSIFRRGNSEKTKKAAAPAPQGHGLKNEPGDGA